MSNNYMYDIIPNEKEEKKEDVVIVINDSYSLSERCDYVTPVPETAPLKFIFVNNSDNEYFKIEY